MADHVAASRPSLTAPACVGMLCALIAAIAASPVEWRDPSPHITHQVTVDDGVSLEVLEWGGNGRPIVLLAGLGHTAHVFDEFGPKLAAMGRVYAITRRGYGRSSRPEAGYDADRLGRDVLAVLDRLMLEGPLLVGHSIAGQELSYLASAHADRIAGVVYLDAAYRYAFFRPGVLENLTALRASLDVLEVELKKAPRSPQELTAVIGRVLGDTLDEFQRDIHQLTTTPTGMPAPARPGPEDLRDFDAYRRWSVQTQGYALPEAELRHTRALTSGGGVGESTTPAAIGQAVSAGSRRFTVISAPALAIFASPHALGPWTTRDPSLRSEFDAFARFDEEMTERQARAFERGVPGARVVRIQNAGHHLYITHEPDVLREIAAFLSTLLR